MKAAIVDDVERERLRLDLCCAKWSVQRNTELYSEKFYSGDEFLLRFRDMPFDLVFLDIYMEGRSGIDTAKVLRETSRSCMIVFLTTSSEHVWEAFPLHPFDYVVKPYEEKKIFSVLDEAQAFLPDNEKFIEITAERKKKRIRFSEICCIISENHHMLVVTDQNERIKAYSTFLRLYDALSPDPRFLLCNRGIIVNMDFIEKAEGQSFRLKNGDIIPLRVKDINRLQKEFAGWCFSGAKHWREDGK